MKPFEQIPAALMAATQDAASSWGLPDRWLVAQIWHESDQYNPFAKRVEPGFMRRYGVAVRDLAVVMGRKTERLHARAPLDFNASYGLMQIMWSTAVERGFRCEYPSELFDVEKNLFFGCAELHRQLLRASGDLGVALDAYNDGRINRRVEGKLVDTDYTDRIRAAYTEVWGVDTAPPFPIIQIDS